VTFSKHLHARQLTPAGVITLTLERETYKYQVSLTNLRDALRHGKRAANKGGR